MFDNCFKKTMKKSKKFENRTADWLLDRAGLFLTIFIYQKNGSVAKFHTEYKSPILIL